MERVTTLKTKDDECNDNDDGEKAIVDDDMKSNEIENNEMHTEPPIVDTDNASDVLSATVAEDANDISNNENHENN